MNPASKINILGIQVDKLTISEANTRIANLISSQKNKTSAVVVKPYVEFLVAAQKDSNIAAILNSADLSLADGVSLQWAASFLYGKPSIKFLKVPRSGGIWLQKNEWRNQIIPEKMAGATQTAGLLQMAEKKKWRIGIIGGLNRPEQIRLAVFKKFPNISYLQTWSGFYKPGEEPSIVDSIIQANLDILFVAMGFPLQEKFIERNKAKGLAKVLIGEGGTFDYAEMGGPVKRAPVWMQKSGIEWLWRLLRQPKRIRRQMAIPQFVWAVKKQSKQDSKNFQT